MSRNMSRRLTMTEESELTLLKKDGYLYYIAFSVGENRIMLTLRRWREVCRQIRELADGVEAGRY